MDNTNLLFSIIIPVYNIEQYIEACIDSVELQAFENYEIVLINDGSADKTGEICRRKAQNNIRIKYIEKNNEGLSAARNDGIRVAEGEYLVFLDGDDCLPHGALENLANALKEQKKVDVLLTQDEMFDSVTGQVLKGENFPKYLKEKSSFKVVTEQFLECYLKHNTRPNAVLSIVRKKYIIDKSLFFEKGILHEDELWMPQVFLNAETVGYCDKVTYLYRVNREGSITKKYQIRNIQDKLYVIQKLCAFADLERKINPEKANMYLSRAACILNGVIGAEFDLLNEPELLEQVGQYIELFRLSVQKKYLLLYGIARVFGIKSLVWMMRYIRKLT